MRVKLMVGAALSAVLVLAPATGASAGGWKGASAVDGDTIKVAGKSVRVIGVDTPERGEKCYKEATQKTASLIKRGVKLKAHSGTGNKDKYGRLLRYVKVRGGKDLGAVLIKKGLAHARYDGKDGYSWHPKQRKYRTLDRKTKNGCKSSSGGSGGGGTTGGNCDPNYSGCVPKVSYDLNCSDIGFKVRVVGSDPHKLDADNDGWGCESYG